MANYFSIFLKANNLKQVEIAQYLGVSETYVSQIVKGDRKLPLAQVEKIKQNGHGWNVEALEEYALEKQSPETADPEVAVLRERVRLLEKLLAEKERTIQILLKK